MKTYRSTLLMTAFALACLGACSDSDKGNNQYWIDAGGSDGFAFADPGPQLDTPPTDPGAAGDEGNQPDLWVPTPDPGNNPDPGTAPDPGPAIDAPNPSGDPVIVVDPAEYTFSYISPVTQVLTKQVNIYNQGMGQLEVTSIKWATGSSPDFSIVMIPPLPKKLNPGASFFVSVRFQDIGGGIGTLEIESNDPQTPLTTAVFDSYLKATIETPDPCAEMNPSQLNFGNVVRGTSKVMQATLKNCSTAQDLVLSDITRSQAFFMQLSEEYQVDNQPNLPMTLAPGTAFTFDVSYAPKLAGPDVGYFAFHTDDPNEPQIHLDVSATGVEPPMEEVGLLIKLSWNEDMTDVDSHLIMPGGSFFDCYSDCHFGNPSPDWGVQSDWIDDPFLDVDDVDGFGPEHINLSEPQTGTYKYVVHYYSDSHDGSFSTDTDATVEVYSYGVLLGTFGPVNLDQTNRNWDVFTIDWPSATVTPLGNTYMISSSQVNSCFNFPGFP